MINVILQEHSRRVLEDVGVAIRENLGRKRFPRNEICRSNHTNSSTTASSGAEWNHSCEDIYICIYSCRLSGRDRSSRIGFSHSNLSRIRGTFYHWLVARILFSILNVYHDLVLISNECSKKWNSIFFFLELELLKNIYTLTIIHIIYRFKRIRISI